MAKAKTIKTYKWEYRQDKSAVVCFDNTFAGEEGQTQAMCADPEIAKCFVDILNESRKPENIL